MIDKYLATEMFEYNALSQFSTALFIYHGGWPVIYTKARVFMAKAKARKSQILVEVWMEFHVAGELKLKAIL